MTRLKENSLVCNFCMKGQAGLQDVSSSESMLIRSPTISRSGLLYALGLPLFVNAYVSRARDGLTVSHHDRKEERKLTLLLHSQTVNSAADIH